MVRCEKCNDEKSDVELRKSDELLCDTCYSKNLIDGMRELANKSFGGVLLQNGELDAEREEDEEADPSDNDAYDGDSEEHVQDKQDEAEEEGWTPWKDVVEAQQSQASAEIFVKRNRKNQESSEKCKKCRKTVSTGVRCSSCHLGFHWNCGGVKKRETKQDIISQKFWECTYCRTIDKNCPRCKDLIKEVKILKRTIVDLEKNLNEINKELADSTLRCLEFEDKAKLERELRRKFEHEMDQLQDKLDVYSSSDDSSISEVSETRNGDDSSNSNNNGDNENGVPSEKRQLTKKSGVSDEARQKQKQKNRPSPRQSGRKKKKLKSDDNENITTPTHLQGAIQYLEKYGKTENHGDDNGFGIPTAERSNKYCYEFAKKGACTKVNCKYMHVAKEAAYPNLSHRANGDRDMNTRRPRPSGHNNRSVRPRPSGGITQRQRYPDPYNYSRKRPFQNIDLSNRINRKVCFNYRDNGFCRYGFHCRYEHVLNENQNRAFHSNINVTDRPNTNLNNQRQMEQSSPFLDEMRSLLTTVRALVESQRLGGSTIAFQGQQAQQFYPSVAQVYPVITQ